MSISLGDVILYLGADDSSLNGVLKGVEGKTTSWVSSLGGKIAVTLGAAVTTAIGGAVMLGTAAFKSGETIDQAFDTILVKTGASGDALAQLQDDFRTVFSSVPTDAQPAAEVLSLIYDRLNLTGGSAQTVTQQILEMSRMMDIDATGAAEAFTRMMGDANMSAEEGSEMLDKLFVASQKSGVGMDRLMQLAVQFGAPMRTMGFTVDQTVALFSKWEAEGVNLETVMGGLRQATTKWISDGKDVPTALQETIDKIKNAESATDGLAIAQETFGAKFTADIVDTIRAGKFDLGEYIKTLEDADGAIMETAAKTEDWGEKLTKLKNRATIALEPIGAKFLDMASMILEKAAPALDKLVPLIDQFIVPAVGRMADALGMLLQGDISGAIDSIFGSGAGAKVSGFVGGIMTSLQPAIDGVQNFFNLMLTWWQMNGPGITQLAQSLFGSISEAIQTIVAKVGPFINEVLSRIGVWFVENGPLIQEFAALIVKSFQERILPTIVSLWGIVQPILSGIVDLVLGLVGTIMQIATGDWAGAWETIKQTAVNVGTALWQAILGLLDTIAHIFGGSLEEIKTIWSNNWELLKQILSKSWDNIKAAVETGINNVIGFFRDTDWGDVGHNILEGIARGILTGLNILRDAAIEAAQTALEAAKGFLGIHSPSMKFAAEVGEPSAAGFGKGFGKKMAEIGTTLGTQALTAGSGMQLAPAMAGATIQIVHNDHRFISLSDEYEAEQVLRPIIERVFRNLKK